MATRTTQHRAQRDANRKELAELKKENTALKRQVSRLKKLLAKTHEIQAEESPEPMPEVAAPAPEPEEKDDNHCPACGSGALMVVRTPTKTLTGCRDCKWRSQ